MNDNLCYNKHDYSFMWWKKSIKTGNQVFAIKTNHYSLAFDYRNLAVQNFSINKRDVPEELVLRETNTESFPDNNPCKLSFGIRQNGNMSWCKTTSGVDDDCQLIETGKYFQRRFITNLPDLKDCERYNSGLEISSWPDRLTFILKVTPAKEIENLGLGIHLEFPEKYSVLLEEGDVKALKNPSDGSGFVILKSAEATSIVISGTTVKVELKKGTVSPAGKEINSGMIIYPVAANIDSKIIEIAELENKPLVITAKQVAPLAKSLKVAYDKDKGWYQVTLRSDKTESDKPAADANEGNPGPQDDLNNRMERVQFSMTNPSNRDKVLRLSFAKGRLFPNGADVFGVPGISAVLRDTNGNPVGIPVQLSKNWHGTDFNGIANHYFRGPWYHGLSMMTIPAKSSITFEYTSVNSMWGGIPAASHAQLCLVGWGHNQQWDESAIGAWGETITYEPDLDQTGAPVLDFRPLMVKSPTGAKWGWTGNLGGADFFNYTKTDGTRGWHSRIRTQYKRYSPNVTEVTYAGTMDDNSMDFEYTASVGRSDDLARGIYKIKLKVLKDIEFKDFVAIQFAAADYHHVKSNVLAWGNETGLKKEWNSTETKIPQYITEKIPAHGNVIWFSFNESDFTSKQDHQFITANRGFVIRNWKARINGQENVLPWFAEYYTAGGNYGDPSGIINITLPADCKSFRKGDFIEAEVQLILLPSKADDYYGPNQNFAKALSKNANSWQMVYREAIGNNLEVEASSGCKVINKYPIQIEANSNSVCFSVTGGRGYVPLTITNLNSYLNPVLLQKVNGYWQKINQAVYGNDFWQTDYNTSTQSWDITFNVNLDTPNDVKQTVEYKFELQ
ncbi:hypothetical protein [Flavobacterium sp.]|uniref:hypothetical protein n=1 Tax=Flavobacterium sp. TaxID=239 RepID=UPI0037C1500B